MQLEANRTAADHEQGRDFAASGIQWELTPFNFFLVNAVIKVKVKASNLEEAKECLEHELKYALWNDVKFVSIEETTV